MTKLQSPTHTAVALHALRRHPDRIAFRPPDTEITYAAALDTIARMQAAMAARGVGRGSTVAVLSANRWETSRSATAATTPIRATCWRSPGTRARTPRATSRRPPTSRS